MRQAREGEPALYGLLCPVCGSRRIRHLGVGTQRVEEEVREVVPKAPLVRLDRDAVRAKGAHAALFERMRSGSAQVIVGPGGLRANPGMESTLAHEHHLRPPLDVDALIHLVRTYCRPIASLGNGRPSIELGRTRTNFGSRR